MPLDLDPRDDTPEVQPTEPSEATNRLKIIDGDIHTSPANLAAFRSGRSRPAFPRQPSARS